MFKVIRFILILLLVQALFVSCALTKRHYLPGYYSSSAEIRKSIPVEQEKKHEKKEIRVSEELPAKNVSCTKEPLHRTHCPYKKDKSPALLKIRSEKSFAPQRISGEVSHQYSVAGQKTRIPETMSAGVPDEGGPFFNEASYGIYSFLFLLGTVLLIMMALWYLLPWLYVLAGISWIVSIIFAHLFKNNKEYQSEQSLFLGTIAFWIDMIVLYTTYFTGFFLLNLR